MNESKSAQACARTGKSMVARLAIVCVGKYSLGVVERKRGHYAEARDRLTTIRVQSDMWTFATGRKCYAQMDERAVERGQTV